MRTHPQNAVPGPQTVENIMAFLGDPEACKERMTELAAAAAEYREMVEAVVELGKLTEAVQAATTDRKAAAAELKAAHEAAHEMRLAATVEAKQTLSDAQREAMELETTAKERKAVLDAHSHDLAAREEAVEEKSTAAADLMAKAQALHTSATAMRDEFGDKAKRMAEIAG